MSDNRELHVGRAEVLRYLGYGDRKADEAVLRLVDACREEAQACASPRRLWQVMQIRTEHSKVLIGGWTWESGTLAAHLAGCREAAVYAVTLGTEMDRRLQRYGRLAPSRAVVLQAAATALLDVWSDRCRAEIQTATGKFLRAGTSPGYEGFPLQYQAELLACLEAGKRIGLRLTDGFQLTPTKSVTGVAGLSDTPAACDGSKCSRCRDTACPFRDHK